MNSHQIVMVKRSQREGPEGEYVTMVMAMMSGHGKD